MVLIHVTGKSPKVSLTHKKSVSLLLLEARLWKLPENSFIFYVHLGKKGLTSAELEDVLSLDEDVLSDVFQYWVPSVRRLPSLLWVRIYADLAQFLVTKGSQGSQVSKLQFFCACGPRKCYNLSIIISIAGLYWPLNTGFKT